MPVVDQGAPTGGRGIKTLTKPKLITEVTDLIGEIVAATVNRTTTKNSVYTSDNFHVDSVPITAAKGLKRCKVEIQEKKGDKDTVAVVILEMHVSSDADVRTGLLNSLNNHHIWAIS